MTFYWGKLREHITRLEAERRLRRRFPTARLSGGVHVVNPAGLDMGDHVQLQQGSVLHCGGLSWSGGEGHIRIGERSVISPYCVLYGAGRIDIGDRFDCGPGSMIFSSRTVPGTPVSPDSNRGHVFAPVVIGDDVTLYAGCVVGPGVTIGNGSVVGAGSVVLHDVPPRIAVAGSPARKLRDLA